MSGFSFPEDAYRIDAEVDGEVVGLDILDTAGQVTAFFLLPTCITSVSFRFFPTLRLSEAIS